MKHLLAITAIQNASAKAPLLLRSDPVGAVREAAALGYDAVEIHVVNAAAFPTEDVRLACRKSGVVISAIVTGQIFTRRKLCITSDDPENRSAAMEELRRYIDLAATLQATGGIVIGWVKGNCPESGQDAFYDLLAAQLCALSDYAADRGQTILVEVINRYETNVFNTAAQLRAFLEQYRLGNVLIHLDTFHMNIEEVDIGDAIRTAGDRLGYLHFADSNRLYPGAGHIDFLPIRQALNDAGYSGTFSVECIPEPDYKTSAAMAKSFIEDLFEKSGKLTQ